MKKNNRISDNKIRVLHVIKGVGLGGAEKNLFNLLSAANYEMFEIHLAYSGGGYFEGDFKQLGVRVFKYANKSYPLKHYYSLIIIFKLILYIMRNRIDIVHTHTFNSHIWGGIAAKLTGRKLIEHVHDLRYMDFTEYIEAGGQGTQFKIVRHLPCISDRIIVLTNKNKEFIVKNKLCHPSKVLRIPNGIALNKKSSYNRNKILNALSLSPDSRVVFSALRFSPEKNVSLIFDVAKKIGEYPFNNVVFIIAGDGPQFGYFCKKNKLEGTNNFIKLLGYRSDVYSLLAASEIFILPSLVEMHPISILEAMSMKIPVILSKNVGCYDEFIENWCNGVLADPHCVADWAESISALLSDDQLRTRIGENGFEVCAHHFNINDVVVRIESLYQELCRDKKYI